MTTQRCGSGVADHAGGKNQADASVASNELKRALDEQLIQVRVCCAVDAIDAGLANEDGHWSRVIIEKPFGRDLESAKALNATVAAVFKESQIYRIDHYLGKDTVQNILVFRFGNSMFEPIWNRNYVDYVEITAPDLGPAPGSGAARMLVAARVGTTRLIDNIALELGAPAVKVVEPAETTGG